MDAVNAFNMELFSMIDMKPPISRAKMMSVTKSAIKAIKLYKHVVQIVEKFIKKCKPELKVPGLYVVDSIIRQSRHQFGVEKDVFGPRFLKNFADTFQNLYLCSEDDKTKVVRVLNLWQKNRMFDMDILQPLLDMANVSMVPAPSEGAGPASIQADPQHLTSSAPVVAAAPQLPSSHALAAVAQLFETSGGQELQKMLQNLQQSENSSQAALIANSSAPAQLQLPVMQPYSEFTDQKSSLAKKLLDRFDYDDEPEEGKNKEGAGHSLGIPGKTFNQFPGSTANMETFHPHMMGGPAGLQHDGGLDRTASHMTPDGYPSMKDPYSRTRGGSREDSSTRREGRQKGYGRRSRSTSGSRSPRRRRSRSTSRSRRSRPRRSGSSSRERRWSSRSRSEDRAERERRQKGLPSIKSQSLSVCSTTLWVGQLDKRTQQSDVMSLLEEFGQIESVNMIPPRGCAYIVMVHRQDAHTALHKLSSGLFKVNQKPIKIAWALNKGIKSTHKKFWDVERGVTYIPWNKVKVEELESFQEGGILDMDTINPDWDGALKGLAKPAALNGDLDGDQGDVSATALLQVPLGQPAAPMGAPPSFPGAPMPPHTSLPPGVPPFAPPRFDPASLSEGFSPPSSGRKPSEKPSNQTNPADTMSPEGGAEGRLGSPGMTRPGMPPMRSPPAMTNPHVPPFLQGPNMPPMLPQMMAGPGPMFPPDRFRMPMAFPPRGPPFPPRHPMEGPGPFPPRHPMGPEGAGPFRGGRPGFGGPPFHRGRW